MTSSLSVDLDFARDYIENHLDKPPKPVLITHLPTEQHHGWRYIAFGPEEPNESDPIVSLYDRSTWKTAQTQSQLTDAIRRKLAEIPGISVLMSQPIQERVDELISGIRTECAIKLFGPDLDVLHDKAEEIATAMQDIQGVKDIKVEQIAGQPYLTIDIDRQKIARYGINVADVQELIGTAIGLLVAYLSGRLVASQVYAIRASDPLMLGGAIVIVVVMTALATMIPAWRASRLAPAVVLHTE